jgi:Mn-dependent DtxR family transcriptional regulator
MQTLTTASLAKRLGLSTKNLYAKLLEADFVSKRNNAYVLTDKGEDAGGKVLASEHGQFIVWPQDFNLETKEDLTKKHFINATKIGEKFDVSNQRVNNILAELGWIQAAIKGWKITNQGREIGGFEQEHQSGARYVIWPDTILNNSFFLKAFNPVEYSYPKRQIETSTTPDIPKSDNKYPESLLKAKDGHIVKSRAELIIDNLLYDYGLLHAYERELTVAETVLSDFYIPGRDGKKAVYIEFWGISDNPKYLERKKHKQEIYKTHKLNLIELDDKHLDNIDSVLRRKFLDYDINVE